MEKKKAGLLRYLKEAFAFRWNLLLFGGAAAAAALSGHGDILLPLVGAAELTYLAGLTSLPRFQAAIDAKAIQEERGGARLPGQAAPEDSRRKLAEVISHLNHHGRVRFQELHRRCHEMRRLADTVSGTTDSTGQDL